MSIYVTQTASMLLVKSIVHFKKVAKIDGKPTVPLLPNVNLFESTYVNEDSKCGRGCPRLNDEFDKTQF